MVDSLVPAVGLYVNLQGVMRVQETTHVKHFDGAWHTERTVITATYLSVHLSIHPSSGDHFTAVLSVRNFCHDVLYLHCPYVQLTTWGSAALEM